MTIQAALDNPATALYERVAQAERERDRVVERFIELMRDIRASERRVEQLMDRIDELELEVERLRGQGNSY